MFIVDSQIHIWENSKMSAHHRQIPTYSEDDALAEMAAALGPDHLCPPAARLSAQAYSVRADVHRRFTNPHLGKQQDVGAPPADPDLFGGRRAGRNGRRLGSRPSLSAGSAAERTSLFGESRCSSSIHKSTSGK